MKTKKIILGLIIVGLITATYVWFFVYNKAHTDYQKASAEFNGSAETFYEEAQGDLETFNTKYLNKAVELRGIVINIDGGVYELEPKINCRLAENATFTPNAGDEVQLKGRYVGSDNDLLTDELVLILDNCEMQIK